MVKQDRVTLPPVLHIRLLGNLGVDYGDEAVTGIDTPRLQSLLSYVLLHPDAPLQRRYVAFQFWPDSTEKQARTNLRQLLHHLRHALPDADRFVDTGTHTIQWRRNAPYMLDVAAFERALGRADRAEEQGNLDDVQEALEEAERLYRDDLLLGCYDEWIEPQRERLRQQYMSALDRLVRLLEDRRAYLEAIHYAGRLLQKDPLRETTYGTLIRLHALRNDRASALRVFHKCASVLERELGVEPAPATRELVERLLDMEASVEARQVPRPSGQKSEAPMVGREPEWERILSAWRMARGGQASFALISGEAGIGKSRLADELMTWASRQGLTTARARCYPAEGRLAFAPIAEMLRADPLQDAVRRVEAVWRTEIGRILSELLTESPDLTAPEPLTESWQRRRLFEALARAVHAASHPMAILIDDLQWCDQDTLEWLHYLLRFDAEAKLLLLGTVRLEEVGPAHPLHSLLLDLRRSGSVTEIALEPLSRDESAALAEHVAGRSLGSNEVAHLHQETEGNPLFVVECIRAGWTAADRDLAASSEASASISDRAATLPPKVHAVLTARLFQCSPSALELAHLAAVVGRAFTFRVIAAASGNGEETLMQDLDELWQRRIVREYGTDTYDFSHDKLREVAYSQLSPVRRRRLHRSVAEALEEIHAAAPTAASEQSFDVVSDQLAVHWERGGSPERAIPYYRMAAQVAQRVFAHEEAINHVNRALNLLDGRPASPQRDAMELELLALLGTSLAAARGFAAPETGRAYARARKLSPTGDNARLRFSAFWGSYAFHAVRAELRKAHEFSEQCCLIAEKEDDASLLVAGHFARGVSLMHLGELARARENLEKASALYEPGQHYESRTFLLGADPGVFSLSYLSHTVWLLGYPDTALEHGRTALALADTLAHPFSRAIALSYLSMLHQLRGESDAAASYAETALSLSAEHNFPYYEAWSSIIKGWAVHQQGEHGNGRSLMSQGLDDLRTIGTGLRVPHYLALLAADHKEEGRLDEGFAVLSEALTTVDRTEERWQEAELHRLKGEMLLMRQSDEAESHIRRALDVARQQQARSLELRAAMSLSRLRQLQGQDQDAEGILTSVYDAFSEGFDTPDLQSSRRLIYDLA